MAASVRGRASAPAWSISQARAASARAVAGQAAGARASGPAGPAASPEAGPVVRTVRVACAQPGQPGELDDHAVVGVDELLLGGHGGGEVVDLVLEGVEDGVTVLARPWAWGGHRTAPVRSAAAGA